MSFFFETVQYDEIYPQNCLYRTSPHTDVTAIYIGIVK